MDCLPSECPSLPRKKEETELEDFKRPVPSYSLSGHLCEFGFTCPVWHHLHTNNYGFEEKVMAPHSSILAWKISWMEEPGGLQSMGSRRVDTTEWLHVHFSLSCIGEGNGNPLQCSCLENHRDGRAWWAAIYGVAQSQTRLKWLSSSSSLSPGRI